MESTISDIRFAVRSLIKRPGFTVVAVLTLALGIGANTAIFSVVYSVLLKSPPFYRADRMVLLWGDDRAEGDARSQVSHTGRPRMPLPTARAVSRFVATLALALAAVGIYGVMSYVVAQRTHEIGIRIALGARIGNIFRLVMRNALWLAIVGILLGAVGAFALTRLMKSLLFGVAPTDLPDVHCGLR